MDHDCKKQIRFEYLERFVAELGKVLPEVLQDLEMPPVKDGNLSLLDFHSFIQDNILGLHQETISESQLETAFEELIS